MEVSILMATVVLSIIIIIALIVRICVIKGYYKKHEHDSLFAENDNLRDEVRQIQEEIDNLTNMKGQLNEDIKERNKYLEELIIKEEVLYAQNEQADIDYHELNKGIQDLKLEQTRLEEQYKAELNNWKEKSKTAKDEYDTINPQLAESKAKQEKLMKEIVNNRLELARLEEQKIVLDNSIKERQEILEENAIEQVKLLKEKMVAEKQAQWKEELEKLLQENDLTKMKAEIEDCTKELEQHRKEVDAIHQEQKALLEKDKYDDVHSISLNKADHIELKLLREFETQFPRAEALRKFMWKEYYEKPLQELRKTLKADKTPGIYKIVNKNNGLMYIGQATDIGNRWIQHVKSGLGIDDASERGQKIYKAMKQDGVENFLFDILEQTKNDKTILNAREKYWIEQYQTNEFGYNMTKGNS